MDWSALQFDIRAWGAIAVEVNWALIHYLVMHCIYVQ